MPRLCANLSFLFGEVPFLERFGAAADAGFRDVECHSPYEHPARDVSTRLRDHGLSQVLINLPAGQPGERGLACLPGRRDDFRAALATAIEYARALGCPNIHLLAGIAPEEGRGLVYTTYADNLARAAELLASEGLTGLIEPLSALEAPGYFLDSLELALRVLDDVAHPNLRLQFDLYHAHLMGLDLAECLRRHAGRIGHIQLADAPGRHEPGTGVIPVEKILEQLDDAGYSGWIGLEYRPRADTTSSLAWARRYLGCASDAGNFGG